MEPLFASRLVVQVAIGTATCVGHCMCSIPLLERRTRRHTLCHIAGRCRTSSFLGIAPSSDRCAHLVHSAEREVELDSVRSQRMGKEGKSHLGASSCLRHRLRYPALPALRCRHDNILRRSHVTRHSHTCRSKLGDHRMRRGPSSPTWFGSRTCTGSGKALP